MRSKNARALGFNILAVTCCSTFAHMGRRRQSSRREGHQRSSSSSSDEDAKPPRPQTSQYEQYQGMSSAESRAYLNPPSTASANEQQQHPYRSWQYQYPVGSSAPPMNNSQYISQSYQTSQSGNRSAYPSRSASSYSTSYYPSGYAYAAMPSVSAPAPVGYLPRPAMPLGPASQSYGAAAPPGSMSDHSDDNEQTESSVTSGGSKTFPCKICGRAFTRNANQNAHMKVHDPNRTKYPCPSSECQKMYGRQIDANRHYKSV